MMRILLAAERVPSGPQPMGGVVSWCWTIRRELERQGHLVDEWQPGMDLGISDGQFDLGILANARLTATVAKHCARVTQVCHGFLSGDQPNGTLGRLVFVSESTRDRWGMDGDVIRQPIDLGFWHPAEGVERSGAVRYSYRRTETHCEAAAQALGMDYRQVGGVTYEAARAALQGAALVFASGRAALEAMACGAPTVVYDNRATYQAPMLNTEWRPEQNYSGRGGIENPTKAQVIEAARRELAGGFNPRRWVEAHHDARRIVQEIIA